MTENNTPATAPATHLAYPIHFAECVRTFLLGVAVTSPAAAELAAGFAHGVALRIDAPAPDSAGADATAA